MAACSNCGKTLSCGCQRRTASNGKAVCSSCLSSYEKSLKPASLVEPKLNTWGKDRYKHLEKFVKK